MNKSSKRIRSRRVEVNRPLGSELSKKSLDIVKMLMERMRRSFINLTILWIFLVSVIRIRTISNIILIQEKVTRESD